MQSALLMTLAAAAVVVVLGLAVVLVVVLTGRRRLHAELDASRADIAALRARVDDLSRDVDDAAAAREVRVAQEYLITSLPDGSTRTDVAVPDEHPDIVHPMSSREFASVALGESLVRVVSFGHGVRRALSAENRNRIRFEMRREVKRARKQRRRDAKEAKRQQRAQQAAGQHDDLTEDAA